MPLATFRVRVSPSGSEQLLVVPSPPAAPLKYTVGPAWSGAQYATFQGAVDAALTDGHGATYGGVLFELYPAFYDESVIIPESLPYFHVSGTGRFVGSFVTSLTVERPNVFTAWSLSNFGITNLIVSQPVAGASQSAGLVGIETYGTVDINAPDLNLVCSECRLINGAQSRSMVTRQMEFWGGRIGTSSGAVALSSTSIIGNSRIAGASINGRLEFAGRGCLLLDSFQEHNGSPAVTDACEVVSFCQGNTFSHNAGPAGAVWVKTGASNFHDGGNSFSEGQVYPWYDIQAGTRSDRAESDTQIRNVLEVSGSPVLTPAQVGGQRKTTVAKTDGGGSVSVPALATVEPGCTITVKDMNGNATASPITVNVDGGGTIDGAPSISLSTDFQSATLQAGSAGWMVI